jgi:hypothetical protein
VAGESVKRHVTADDEWCAEAYMETDYAQLLSREAYEKCARDYLMFQLVNEAEEKARAGRSTEDEEELSVADAGS